MKKLRTLTLDEHDFFQVDKKNRLYFRGKRVLLKRKIQLNIFERILATIASAGIVLEAIVNLLTYIHS